VPASMRTRWSKLVLDHMDTAALETVEPRRVAKATFTRIFLIRGAITLLVASATFGALEVLLDKYYLEGQSQNWTTFHAERGWALTPGDYWVKSPRDMNKIAIHINPYGLRSRNSAADVPKHRRVTILGDSFVFARESTFDDSFPQRLETLLNQRMSGGAEVVNAGIPAYGTGQELLLVKELFRRYGFRSDLYLLMFFTNDTLDNLCLSYANLQFQPVRPCFELAASGEPKLTKLPEYLPHYQDDALVTARPSQFGQRTAATLRAWAEQRLQAEPRLVDFFTRLGMTPQLGRMPGIVNAWYRDDVLRKGVPLTAALLVEMKREIEAQGGRLLVSMVPSPFQIYPETYIPLLREAFPFDIAVADFSADIRRPQRLVRELCEKAGVPFQDLLPTLLEYRATPLIIPRDGHLTRAGHKLVSEVLLPFVLAHADHNDKSTALLRDGRLP
jgi:GDSL-like Lipase/Acylhydrolase family